MDNFKAVYKILSSLEKAMDLTEFDPDTVGAAVLGVSQERWNRYIEMLRDVGYIKGVTTKKYTIGGNILDYIVDCKEMCITLQGLEYLQENAIMQKMHRTAKGMA